MMDVLNRILMVIPSINGGRLLRRMLPTLRFPLSNVIVLDQGSSDSTAEVCATAGVEMVQLGDPHTYTQACNIGADLARKRGAAYICVSNNDIAFRTNVMLDMATEMERDPLLGIVAPGQIVVDEALGDRPLSNRVLWSLDRVDFFHDTSKVDGQVERLEADFCELTCALIRMSAIDEIGFLDDEFGFYHEDADFGFRLRKAGYSCAYLPRSQIDHFHGSTFNLEKLSRKSNYIAKNKLYFAQKHLGYGTSFPDQGTLDAKGDIVEDTLHRYLRRYGLLNKASPQLSLSHLAGDAPYYLYTTSMTADVPPSWPAGNDGCEGIFASNEGIREALIEAGFRNSFYVPLGIETDIFHPWASAHRPFDEITYLATLDWRQAHLTGRVIQAWQNARRAGKRGWLILMGEGILARSDASPDSAYRWGGVEIARFNSDQIEIREVLSPQLPEDLANLYRAVDYTVLGPDDGASPASVFESLACGVPSLAGGFASFNRPDQFSDLATSSQLLEPSVEDLVARFERGARLSDHERQEMGRQAIYYVRNRHTLRDTAIGFYGALSELQQRDPHDVMTSLRRRQPVGQAMGWTKALLGDHPSAIMARQTKTLGRIILQIGTIWENEGVRGAGRATAAKARRSLSHGVGRLSRASTTVARRAKQNIVDTYLGPKPPLANSTLLIGYINGQLGLGQSLRGLAFAMLKTGARFRICPFSVGVKGRLLDPYLPELYDRKAVHAVNVIEVSPDELHAVFENIGGTHFDRSYNILRTYWELSKAPDSWRSQMEHIHEIWAPNTFVANSLRLVFDGPITIVPPCVNIPDWDRHSRIHFDLEESRFYFLFSFDYFSFPQRKNPLAVIRAFRQAFPAASEKVGLVIKSTGSVSHFPRIREELRTAARQDRRIKVIDESLSREEMLSLMAATDCYVSLHRSEGFGLGMAEAMALGKPVIGTNYSANTEFLRNDTGYPVSFRMKTVGASEYVHSEGQVWADPNEASCSAAMVSVFENPDAAICKALVGQRFVRERFGPENVGQIVQARLQEIFNLLVQKQSKEDAVHTSGARLPSRSEGSP